MQNKRLLKTYQNKYAKSKKKDKRLVDSQSYTIGQFGNKYRPDLASSAYNLWNSMSKWREQIVRNEEFVFGDQHSDLVFDWKNHKYKTERQMFVEQGLQPSQYNIVRNIVRTMTGVWGSNKTLPTCIAQKDDNQEESEMLTATLHVNYRNNALWRYDVSQMTQLAITGVAIARPTFANRDGDADVFVDYVCPFSFFVDNTMKDPRYRDCTIVGCWHDMAIEDIAAKFSKGDKKRAKEIRNTYSGTYEDNNRRVFNFAETFTDKRQIDDFFNPPVEKQGLGRVLEIWRKESAECYWIHDWLHGTQYPDFNITEAELKEINKQRILEQGMMGVADEDMLLLDWEWGRDTYWKYYYMTVWGDVLEEGINPYWHAKPPIIFEFHDFYLGKIYPFVKDIIDANKQINKLIAVSELLVKYSAKSTTFVPVEGIAEEEGYDLEFIEDRISQFDAIIPYKSKHQGGQSVDRPHHINTVAEAFTPMNVISMYLKLSENISGIYGALQGQQPAAGTPAQMYAQQSQNSATSLVNIFESMNSFRTRRDKMIVQLMQQFYNNKKYVFDKNLGEEVLYDPDKVRNIEFLTSIVENTDTPAYRLMINDMLFQLKQFDPMNQIDLRGMVEVGNLPFKEKLLDYMNKREQEMEEAMLQGQQYAGTPMPQDLQADLQNSQFNPQLMQQFEQLPEQTKQDMFNYANQN